MEEVEIGVYTKSNYMELRSKITRLLLNAGLTVTERRYVAYEQDTGFHHYSITAAEAHIFGEG